MPRAAHFSEEFYAKLGHGIANEIVGWFNSVDLAYRIELEERNEKNFQRFEAVLRGEIAGVNARIDGVEVRFEAVLRAEIAGVNARIDGIEARLDKKIEVEVGSLRTDLATMRADILKWMVFLFLGAVLTVVGLG